jgi:hypothetical protein
MSINGPRHYTHGWNSERLTGHLQRASEKSEKKNNLYRELSKIAWARRDRLLNIKRLNNDAAISYTLEAIKVHFHFITWSQCTPPASRYPGLPFLLNSVYIT